MTISIWPPLCCPTINKGADPNAFDDWGFPLAKWTEDRKFSKETVVCFITEGTDGTLLFASTGGLPTDLIYRQRPWEKLIAFKPVPAAELYNSGIDRRLQHEFANRNALLRVLVPNDTIVMTAEFADDHSSIPMHLNCGKGTGLEIAELHNVLQRRFINQRQHLIDTICHGEFKLPQDGIERSLLTELRILGVHERALRDWKELHKKESFFGRLFG